MSELKEVEQETINFGEQETVAQEAVMLETEEQQLPTIREPRMEQNAVSIWNDEKAFETAQRTAKLLAASNIVPQQYRGKVADCVIAVDIAGRMGLSPLAVMQNSQIVQGNFSWKGTACKAMIDSCGKYRSTRYVEVGTRNTDSWGYYLEAITKDGEVVKGITVDISTAKREGWYNKNGSKWQTLPELMLKYRAAAFFMRTECAGLAMGFLTSEENEDIYGADDKQNGNHLTSLLDEVIEKEKK